MLSSGSLNQRVFILVPEVTRNEFGEQQTEWTKAKKVWANVIFKRGSQALNVGEAWMSRAIAVTMRDNNLINERCRLEWDGKIYAIDSLNRSRPDGSITITAVAIDENK